MFAKHISFLAVMAACAFATTPAPTTPATEPVHPAPAAGHPTTEHAQEHTASEHPTPEHVAPQHADQAAHAADSVATVQAIEEHGGPAAVPAEITAVPAAPEPVPATPVAPATPAKEAIIENPVEFIIVSVVFVATVLLIALTGNK